MEICVQTLRGYFATLAVARWCEAAGVPALAVADHYLSGIDRSGDGLDQLVLLGGIARETRVLELSTLVSPITFRHPAVHLKAAVTLDQMSCGRFSLGVGTGWMELEHEAFGLSLYPLQERFDRLEETLNYLTAALDGSGRGFAGHYYQLAPFVPKPTPQHLRLVVGGGGQSRTPNLAGRFAHEFNAFPAENIPIADRIATCRRAAASAGRDPDSLLISSAFPAVVAPDRASAEVLVQRWAERWQTEPDEVRARLDRKEIPHGTPETAAESYAALAAAGVQRVYVQAGTDLDDVAEAVDSARQAVSDL
jgi:alkanesulfonate monooxygenase SsuD/methylene tetrahydromethanopterin reductase-like flavin-dependent oxidoreductase (luciferase family)